MAARRPAPAVCPVCGEDVPRNARACPDCGADHLSGWREDTDSYEGAGGPEEFDYDQFVREEFGSSIKPAGVTTFWWIAAILTIFAFAILFLRGIGVW